MPRSAKKQEGNIEDMWQILMKQSERSKDWELQLQKNGIHILKVVLSADGILIKNIL